MTTLKTTDKSNELERQVSALRARHHIYSGRICAKNVRVEQLIGFREPLRNLIHSANNSLMCSMMYSDNSFKDQLSHTKENLISLSCYNERVISKFFAAKQTETAAAARQLFNLSKSLPLSATPREGYTGYVNEAGRVVPVYHLTYSGVPDISGFVHSEYSIWFQSNREFSTGFVGWPSDENWQRVKAARDLLPALNAALVEDGIGAA